MDTPVRRRSDSAALSSRSTACARPIPRATAASSWCSTTSRSRCDDNEIVALLGRSGSGKSTLLRIIAGLMPPTSGTRRRSPASGSAGPPSQVAMVFQSFALFPWLTVLENVEIGLEAQGIAPAERQQARARRDRPDRARRLSRAPIRRSCRAACASGSGSPARWSSIPTCC